MLRVYGLWVHKGRVLLSKERFAGRNMVKFPGGGLEFGEGLIDGLCREWREETGLSPVQPQHLYTTDFFSGIGVPPGRSTHFCVLSFRAGARAGPSLFGIW